MFSKSPPCSGDFPRMFLDRTYSEDALGEGFPTPPAFGFSPQRPCFWWELEVHGWSCFPLPASPLVAPALGRPSPRLPAWRPHQLWISKEQSLLCKTCFLKACSSKPVLCSGCEQGQGRDESP